MTSDEKWEFINQLDDELLKGGVMLSEWSTFIAKDAQIAFCSGANLAAILSAQAAVESHLKYEFFNPQNTKGWSLYRLLSEASLPEDLIHDLQEIRKFRNKWVHVNDPTNDQDLLEKPLFHEEKLEEIAKLAIRSMMRVLYQIQFT